MRKVIAGPPVRSLLSLSNLSPIESLAVATKSPSPDLEIMETPKHSKHRLNPMFMPPSRSSTRIARKPMLFERKKMVQVDIAKEDTVKDLKVKVRLPLAPLEIMTDE
jgi:hypothetical protein